MSRDRETVAAVAARIVVESGLTDWTLARRKAVAELGLGAHGSALPTDEQIVAEIKVYLALYGGADWVAQLRDQREWALEAMVELARFKPMLVGPVAEGWAHAASEIRIELSAESAKDVEYALLNLDVEFNPVQAKDGTMLYEILDGDWPMRLVVREPGRSPDPRHKVRLSGAQVQSMLQEVTASG